MKTLFLLLALALPAAADPLDDVRTRARPELLKPLALDLGGVIGATGFHNGQPLGFPGFELGLVGATQFKPDQDNLIFRDAGVKAFGVPMLHGAVGLPLKFDIVGHGLKIGDGHVIGGGVRYCIFKSGKTTLPIPSVGVSVFGDAVNPSAFTASHYAFNVGASWHTPIVSPFLGAGWDLTEIKVRDATAASAIGAKATARGSRLTGGVDVTPFPFLRLRGAAMLLHGIPGMSISIGAKF